MLFIKYLDLVYNSIISIQKRSIMERKSKKLSYIDGHHLEEGVLKPTIKDVEIMMTGTKRFHNCLYLILGLSKLQRILMDWISEEMDSRNMIRNEAYNRKLFIDFVSSLVIDGENRVYKDSSVNTAFHDLKVSGLLIPVSKSVYQVNPNYYWGGTDKDRVNEIMMNIQFASSETNFRVIPNGKDFQITKKGKK